MSHSVASPSECGRLYETECPLARAGARRKLKVGVIDVLLRVCVLKTFNLHPVSARDDQK